MSLTALGLMLKFHGPQINNRLSLTYQTIVDLINLSIYKFIFALLPREIGRNFKSDETLPMSVFQSSSESKEAKKYESKGTKCLVINQ